MADFTFAPVVENGLITNYKVSGDRDEQLRQLHAALVGVVGKVPHDINYKWGAAELKGLMGLVFQLLALMSNVTISGFTRRQAIDGLRAIRICLFRHRDNLMSQEHKSATEAQAAIQGQFDYFGYDWDALVGRLPNP